MNACYDGVEAFEGRKQVVHSLAVIVASFLSPLFTVTNISNFAIHNKPTVQL